MAEDKKIVDLIGDQELKASETIQVDKLLSQLWGKLPNCKHINHYLALINRAGGLYGRILTKVVSTDRIQ